MRARRNKANGVIPTTALLLGAALLPFAFGADGDGRVESAGGPVPPNAAAGSTAEQTPRFPAARRVTEELLGDARRRAVILPSQPGKVGQDPAELSGGAQEAITPELPLLPEGYVLYRRDATIEWDGDWCVAHVGPADGVPDAPPLRILPNQEAEGLEAVTAAESGDLRYVITGRVTEFQGANYLLLDNVERVRRIRDDVPDTASTPDHVQASWSNIIGRKRATP